MELKKCKQARKAKCPCHCDVLDIFTSHLEWFEIGEDPNAKAPDKNKLIEKPFLGIGPDHQKAMRGTMMPWPYHCDGSPNKLYTHQVSEMEIALALQIKREEKTQQALEKMMDDVIAGHRIMPSPEEFMLEMAAEDMSKAVIRHWTRSMLKILVEEVKKTL